MTAFKSTHAKGMANEAKLIKYLLRIGFKQVWKPAWSKWGNKDILDLFDMVAIDYSGKTWFIQCKSRRDDSLKAYRKISKWAASVNWDDSWMVAYPSIEKGKWIFLYPNPWKVGAQLALESR